MQKVKKTLINFFKSKWSPSLAVLLIVAASLVSLFFSSGSFSAKILESFDRVKFWRLDFLLMSLVSLFVFVPISSAVWRESLRKVGVEPPGLVVATFQVSLSLVGKYLPGKVWSFLIKHQVVNGSFRNKSIALVVEQVALVVGGMLLSVPALLWLLFKFDLGSFWEYPVGAGRYVIIVVVVILLASAVLALKRVESLIAHFFPSLNLLLFAVLAWVSSCVSLVLLICSSALPVEWGAMLGAVLALPLAVMAGAAIPFLPAGLGVREGVLVAMLSVSLNVEDAVLMALAFRALAVFRDMLVGVSAGVVYFVVVGSRRA